MNQPPIATENDAVTDLLRQVSSLPPPPKLLPQLLAILSDPTADISRVVDIVTLDPALTIKALQLCNSSYFAFSSRVENLAEAVMRLGFHGIFQIVAVISGEQFLRTEHTGSLDVDRLWRHLVCSGFAAHELGSRVGADENILFTAGLLHDIGKIPLAEVLQGDYAALITDSGLSGQSLSELESASFGMNHAEVGAELLRRWNFSAEFATSIEFHHQPAAAGEFQRTAACLALADAIAHSLDETDSPAWEDSPDLAAAAALLNFRKETIERVRDAVMAKAKSIEAMCGVSA